MKLIIGRRHSIEVASLEEASRIYCTLRDESGEGASTFPDGKVGDYRVAYNGKVFFGKYTPGQSPVFDPYAQVAA